MPRRTRTAKKLAQRIRLDYFQRPHPLRRWRFLLSAGLPALAAAWLIWLGFARSNRIYSSGPMAPAHAVLTARCSACHVSQAGRFRERATDQACLDCHDGPVHHANQVFTPSCSSCHVEHRGRLRLAATSDQSCAQCHADLHARGGSIRIVRRIEGFPHGHPEFALLRERFRDPGTIQLNHAAHMKAGLKGPDGQPVQMACRDCHRTPAAEERWPYAAPQFLAASTKPPEAVPDPLAPVPERAYFAPPRFAETCSGCHLLQFDKRFAEGVPHDKPQIVHAFVVKRFQEYIRAHPAELRVVRQPNRNLPERPIPPPVRVLTVSQWVAERAAEAELLLWRKTCKQCHALTLAPGAALPEVVPARITVRWYPHAKFDHQKHRMLACTSCHSSVLDSRETSDVLVPGIRNCAECHRPGEDAAEARCFECHVYHDWSKREPVHGRFTLPGIERSAVPVLGAPASASVP